MLRLGFVTGTEPGKWFARYRDVGGQLEEIPSDDPFQLLTAGEADAVLMRLPDPRVGEAGDVFHQVRLYAEAPGVAVPKDSVYAEVGEKVRLDDVADEHVNYIFHETERPLIDDLRAALQVVAANVGVAFAPLPLLKALSKKQVVVLELAGEPAAQSFDGTDARTDARADARLAPTEIALVWKVAEDSDAIQDFVGVAKGRTRNSSRSSVGGGRGEKQSRGKKRPSRRR